MIGLIKVFYSILFYSRQANNQLAGESLSHMQTLGYHGKMCLKYVIKSIITYLRHVCRDNPKSAYAITSFPPTGYQPAVMITGSHVF